MKFLFTVLIVSAIAFADEEKKAPPQPVQVVAPRALATYRPDTGEWSLEKGAKPEDVYTALAQQISQLQNRLKECEAPKAKKAK